LFLAATRAAITANMPIKIWVFAKVSPIRNPTENIRLVAQENEMHELSMIGRSLKSNNRWCSQCVAK
jgi:hypothetical protein